MYVGQLQTERRSEYCADTAQHCIDFYYDVITVLMPPPSKTGRAGRAILFSTSLFFFVSYHTCEHDLFQTDELISVRVTTCLENLEMSRNLTAVREMSGILLKIREMSGKSCLKLFIVNCIFVSIQVFSRSLFCLKC